jgi:hypothetical protein
MNFRYLTAELVKVPAGRGAGGGDTDVAAELDLFYICLSFVGLAIVFHAIYVVCDEHLVPGTVWYCVTSRQDITGR